MESEAYRHAVAAKTRAERALERLRLATNLEEAEEAWDHFLHSASRVHEKLRAGANDHGKTWAWFKLKLDERATDPLLVYMHHARNSDHHRFENVTEWSSGARGFAHRPVASGIIFLRTVGHNLRLVPVIDKGIEYPVATEHRGAPIADADAMTAGRLMLRYLAGVLEEANSLLR